MRDETLPTLSDVANQARVSLSTASRVLSGSKDRVSPALRERVLAAARELRYVPNAHAQALVRARTSTVGLVVHDVSDPYFSEIARGVFRTATEQGLLVMICNSFRDPARELEYVDALRAQRVMAIVLAGSGYEDEELEGRINDSLRAFEASGGRATLVGRHHLSVDAVLPDNVGGARAMTEALVQLGHRRIAVLSGPPHLTTVVDRLDGVRGALEAAGLDLPGNRVVACDFTREGGYEATNELMEQAPEVTAIFALNDTMAIGSLVALRERGLEAPKPISVAGFDDIPATRDVTPALSTVRLPMEGMGVEAMTLALRPRVKRPRAKRTTSEVIIRESTAPPGSS